MKHLPVAFYKIGLSCLHRHICHATARFGAAAAEFGTGEHLLIPIRHPFALLRTAFTDFGTDAADTGMQRCVEQHKIGAGLTNFSHIAGA